MISKIAMTLVFVGVITLAIGALIEGMILRQPPGPIAISGICILVVGGIALGAIAIWETWTE